MLADHCALYNGPLVVLQSAGDVASWRGLVRHRGVSEGRDGCRWDSTPHDPVGRVRLQGTGHIDVGVTHFLTTSEGVHVANPRHGRRNTDAQRALKAFPRNQRSAKYGRAVEKVATLPNVA